jgi:hypothetical protein
MLVVGLCDFPPIERHDGWGSLKEVVEEGKGGPAGRDAFLLNWKNLGCPTLAFFARVGIRDLSGLGMLVVGICDFPPIEMHDGWGSLKEVVEE